MELKFERVRIVSFKGLSKFDEKLSDGINSLVGTNETGKTTVANGIIWCLFGKDIYGRSNYEIMPLDENNKVIPHMEPCVELTVDIDGSFKVLKREMVQKWVKKRGEAESSFDGSCTTNYFVDDVPVQQKEYNAIVDSIISEDLFRVLTLPTFLPLMDWKKVREMIIGIVGDVDIAGISSREEFAKLVAEMKGKSVEDFRKMIALQKKELKRDIDRIPASIEATEQFIPETEPDYEQIKIDIEFKEQKIVAIDKKISDKTSVLDDYRKKLKENSIKIKSLEQEKEQFIADFTKAKQAEIDAIDAEKLVNQTETSTVSRNIREVDGNISSLELDIVSYENQLKDNQAKRDRNKAAYDEAKNSVFVSPVDSKCPTCGTVLEKTEQEIEDMKLSFNNNKADKMDLIIRQNKPIKLYSETLENETIPNAEKALLDAKNRKVELEEKLNELAEIRGGFISRIASVNLSKAKMDAIIEPGYKALEAEIERLSKIDEAPVVDTSVYDAEKLKLRTEITTLQAELNEKPNIDKARRNIEQYKKEGKEKSQRLAELEGMEYASELFEKAIAEDVEQRINSRLDGRVSFKMFNVQNNGGLTPTCEILVEGVPYNSTNTASQIQAGITIINLMSEHYDVVAPIIIDNRESVIEIPKTKGQIINMIVDESVKSLTLKN